MRNLFFFGLLALLLSGCKPAPTAPGPELRIRTGGATFYSAPGKGGTPLGQLAPGEPVVDLGRVSSFVTPLHFADSLLEAPWLEVQRARGERGWIFAAAAAPAEGSAAEWFLRKRLDCFVGPALAPQCLHWRDSIDAVTTDDALAAAYRRGVFLRDAVLRRLHARAEPNEAGFTPDLFWLPDALPGFIVQYVAAARDAQSDSSGRVPWLFVDYRYWLDRAATASGTTADSFFQICRLAYPADSIESLFPRWTIQTGERSGSSQLGEGRHLEMLLAIDRALAGETPFRDDLIALKTSVIDDIVDGSNTYWQPVEKILAELNLIIENDIRSLNERDRLSLGERRALFEAAAENGIRVNLRSGE